jgi:hypothetical protein
MPVATDDQFDPPSLDTSIENDANVPTFDHVTLCEVPRVIVSPPLGDVTVTDGDTTVKTASLSSE